MQYIKELELQDGISLNAYFEYIYLSLINGQRTQVKELINKLNKPQKLNFHDYLNMVYQNTEYKNELIRGLI